MLTLDDLILSPLSERLLEIETGYPFGGLFWFHKQI